MAKNKRSLILYPILFILLIILEVSFLWKYDVLLIIASLVTLFLKHQIIPLKKEFTWFLTIGFTGAFGESLMMLSGPWSYAAPNFLNFPIWLIALWGVSGCVAVSLYKGIASD